MKLASNIASDSRIIATYFDVTISFAKSNALQTFRTHADQSIGAPGTLCLRPVVHKKSKLAKFTQLSVRACQSDSIICTNWKVVSHLCAIKVF